MADQMSSVANAWTAAAAAAEAGGIALEALLQIMSLDYTSGAVNCAAGRAHCIAKQAMAAVRAVEAKTASGPTEADLRGEVQHG